MEYENNNLVVYKCKAKCTRSDCVQKTIQMNSAYQ